MSAVEEKAIAAFEANRALAPKYHIDESMWIDWYTKGYYQAVEDLGFEISKSYARGLSDIKECALETFINGAEGYDDFERDLEELSTEKQSEDKP